MKVGLVGTGPWARMAHGPGLVQADGVELVGVWGRRPEEAGRFASALDATAYDDYAVMLGDVDAVAFAVPPDIQAEMALQAASAGKHLLLDKPDRIRCDCGTSVGGQRKEQWGRVGRLLHRPFRGCIPCLV